MELTLKRQPSNALATLGHLRVDGVPFCVTLEDMVRDLGTEGKGKVWGQTAIPAGRYAIDITWSVKFQKDMILVRDVPHFTGIRIHSGNDAEDTLGCILVGNMIDGPTRIHGGSMVMPSLFNKICKELDKKISVWLTVVDAEASPAPSQVEPELSSAGSDKT